MTCKFEDDATERVRSGRRTSEPKHETANHHEKSQSSPGIMNTIVAPAPNTPAIMTTNSITASSNQVVITPTVMRY